MLSGTLNKNHLTNEEVSSMTQNAIGVHGELTMVKERKLRWYGHISRSSGMVKTTAGGGEGSKKETKTEEEMGIQRHRMDRNAD